MFITGVIMGALITIWVGIMTMVLGDFYIDRYKEEE